jgi:hypothetical protein
MSDQFEESRHGMTAFKRLAGVGMIWALAACAGGGDDVVASAPPSQPTLTTVQAEPARTDAAAPVLGDPFSDESVAAIEAGGDAKPGSAEATFAVRTDRGVVAYWIPSGRADRSAAPALTLGTGETAVAYVEMFLPQGIVQIGIEATERGGTVEQSVIDTGKAWQLCAGSDWREPGCISREELLVDPWATDLIEYRIP